jgi:very-short-patch-repair endonuclease
MSLDEPWAWVSVGDYGPRILETIAVRMALIEVCESPIEIDLGARIRVLLGEVFEMNNILLIPQYKWKQFRIDFAVVREVTDEPVLFIECDGRDYHSSPEQIARDKIKDGVAARAGITLLRFSGSEIYRFADGCVQRVLEHLVRGGYV